MQWVAFVAEADDIFLKTKLLDDADTVVLSAHDHQGLQVLIVLEELLGSFHTDLLKELLCGLEITRTNNRSGILYLQKSLSCELPHSCRTTELQQILLILKLLLGIVEQRR